MKCIFLKIICWLLLKKKTAIYWTAGFPRIVMKKKCNILDWKLPKSFHSRWSTWTWSLVFLIQHFKNLTFTNYHVKDFPPLCYIRTSTTPRYSRSSIRLVSIKYHIMRTLIPLGGQDFEREHVSSQKLVTKVKHIQLNIRVDKIKPWGNRHDWQISMWFIRSKI